MSVEPLVVPRLAALSDVPHALPYQGSKRALAHAIVRLVPASRTHLVEPFAGSAAVAIAARHTGLADRVTIGDLNEPLMGLWSAILDDPGGLADEYERLWSEQLGDPHAYYATVRERFNDDPRPHHLLYLLARCVKAAVRYSRAGRFNQSADRRRLGARPAAMRDRLVRTSAAIAGASVRVGDYSGLLSAADGRTLVYLDPPYQGTSSSRDHRYVRGLDRDGFESVLRAAVARDVAFIVSYDMVSADERYGRALSASLGLTHLHVAAGRSSQATLQGLSRHTVESLYLSPALVDELGGRPGVERRLTVEEPVPVRRLIAGRARQRRDPGDDLLVARAVAAGPRDGSTQQGPVTD